MGGRLAESMHVRFEVGFELLSVSRRPLVSEGRFQVAVEIFVRIAFRAVGGQVKDFALLLVFTEPFLDGPAVVDFEVVHDEQDLPSRILDQPRQEPAEPLAGQRIAVDHPAHLSLLGHRGDHIDGEASGREPDHRRLALGRVTTPVLAITAHPRLIAPVESRPCAPWPAPQSPDRSPPSSDGPPWDSARKHAAPVSAA